MFRFLHETHEAPLKLGARFFEEHEAQNFPRLRGTTFSSETLVEPVSHLEHSLRRQALQHFGHQTVGRAVGFVAQHLSSCLQNLIHVVGLHDDLHSFAVFESSRPEPRRFHLCRRSIVHSGLQTSSVHSSFFPFFLIFFHSPFVSVFTGEPVDPELRDHKPVDHLASGQHCLSRLEFASSFLGDFAQVSSFHGVPAFGCIRRHLSDVFRLTKFCSCSLTKSWWLLLLLQRPPAFHADGPIPHRSISSTASSRSLRAQVLGTLHFFCF